MNFAAARPGHQLAYLEVTEPTNERRSFDLNMYDAQLQVQDLQPILARMSEYFAVPAPAFLDLYERIKTMRFGHLAGGIHRGGQDFFNLYYGMEQRQGKTMSGFGDLGAGDLRGKTGDLTAKVADFQAPIAHQQSGNLEDRAMPG